jgi:hypothetical protein
MPLVTGSIVKRALQRGQGDRGLLRLGRQLRELPLVGEGRFHGLLGGGAVLDDCLAVLLFCVGGIGERLDLSGERDPERCGADACRAELGCQGRQLGRKAGRERDGGRSQRQQALEVEVGLVAPAPAAARRGGGPPDVATQAAGVAGDPYPDRLALLGSAHGS